MGHRGLGQPHLGFRQRRTSCRPCSRVLSPALSPTRVRSRITACGRRRCCSTCAMRSALATVWAGAVAPPVVVDADRSLPVPASPHDWLAERKFALDEGLHRVATCRPTFNVKTLTVGFRPLPQTTRTMDPGMHRISGRFRACGAGRRRR